MTLDIRWGNRLESLADDLFGKLAAAQVDSPAQVFARRDAIVVSNRLQQAWLRQRFLLGAPRRSIPHVLANCDFPLLGPFVGDWLFRMDHPDAAVRRPNPEEHPFSVKSLRWRIFDFLRRHELHGEFAPLRAYVAARDDAPPDDRKCFKLAGRLAKLFDDYSTYRPDMLHAWERGRIGLLDPALAWEPALWNAVTRARQNQTHLAAFRRMERALPACGVENAYRRLFVFAPSMLPGAHLAFFRALGAALPVHVYLFNPSPSTDWFDRDSARARLARQSPLERADDDDEPSDGLHPLLGAYGRGARDVAAQALDLSDGQIEEDFAAFSGDSLLARLQRSVAECDDSSLPENFAADGSIQIHRCHGKMREVEILRDQILRCFEDMPGLQPRDVQVQISDMNAYAPYVEAVFSARGPSGAPLLPFALADRVAAGESPAAEAFRQLLDLADGRFAAPDVLDLLRCETVARRFDFSPADLDWTASWLNRAGVRWGRDSLHRKDVSHASFEEQTSWRHGLDRLLTGYVFGREPAADLASGLLPLDAAEGTEAVLLGRLARFYGELERFAKACAASCSAAAWADRLDHAVGVFFADENDSFSEISILRSAIDLLRTSALAAEFDGDVPLSVVRDFLSGHLGETSGGGDLDRNAVVFGALRPGSGTPRRVQCLLGMGDAQFPRQENRPAYDLARAPRKLGDRSPAVEDRLAFLEALLNARERFFVFLPAFSEEDNSPIGESVVVRELAELLDRRCGPNAIRTTVHRLQSFHPAYFGGDPGRNDLFSYSAADCAAARALAAPRPPPSAPSPAGAAAAPTAVALEDLAAFFRNPAEFFYRQVAGANCQFRRDDSPDDTEPFDPSHLEEARVRRAILDSLVEGQPLPLAPLRRRLAADGQIPLGSWGQRWFDDAVAEVVAVLDASWPTLGSLRSVLDAARRRAVQPASVDVSVDGVHVLLSGTLGLFDAPDGVPTALRFRFSAANAAAPVGAWIDHLLGRAAGLPLRSIVVQGKSADKLDAFQFADLPAADSLLADMLRVYLAGQRRIPPFPPAAAFCYAEALAKAGNSPEAPDKAMAAAKRAWTSNSARTAYDGDQDPHLRAALGPEGPFRDDAAAEFSRLAESLFLPLLRARIPLVTAEVSP